MYYLDENGKRIYTLKVGQPPKKIHDDELFGSTATPSIPRKYLSSWIHKLLLLLFFAYYRRKRREEKWRKVRIRPDFRPMTNSVPNASRSNNDLEFICPIRHKNRSDDR